MSAATSLSWHLITTRLAGALLGSETMKVLTHTSIPVLVYRQT